MVEKTVLILGAESASWELAIAAARREIS
jgi:hypothetical protein